jgi:hypothetical protein
METAKPIKCSKCGKPAERGTVDLCIECDNGRTPHTHEWNFFRQGRHVTKRGEKDVVVQKCECGETRELATARSGKQYILKR